MASDPVYGVVELALPGVLSIAPRLFRDERGFFVETYNERAFVESGITTKFVQDNLSYSKKGVLRGLHYQSPPHAQVKLVRCAYGEILDVVADIDPRSPTFGQHIKVPLSAKSAHILYVPGEYAHGFCVLSDEALVEYKVSDFYAPEHAGGVRYDDPILSVQWPILDPILSEQDKKWPMLKNIPT
jgi:dTDP-4-dehydrorhamnose 3,5-epimerase